MSNLRQAVAALKMASTNVWHALNAWPEEPPGTSSCNHKMGQVIDSIDALIVEAENQIDAQDDTK